MTSLEFTLAEHGRQANQVIDGWLHKFEKESHHTVQTHRFGWDTIWRELVNIGIYKTGADLSEVGSTWIPSLVSMNALRPFSKTEVAQLGGAQVFLPSSWQTASLVGQSQVWAIPWAGDVRLVFYWRDMLDQAGVEEASAFQSVDAFRNTLEQLKKVLPAPLGLQTSPSDHEVVYGAACWLRASGSDYLTPDGKQTRFNEAAGREGLRAYFELYRYLPKENQPMNAATLASWFLDRKVAVAVGGIWMVPGLWQQAVPPEISAHIGLALPPGPPFVGGTNLVIWNHSTAEEAAFRLIRYLTQPAAQTDICHFTGSIPVRIEAVDSPAYAHNAHFQMLRQAIKQGRPMPMVPLWGLVEQRVTETFTRIWAQILAESEPNVNAILDANLNAFARRLDATLSG